MLCCAMVILQHCYIPPAPDSCSSSVVFKSSLETMSCSFFCTLNDVYFSLNHSPIQSSVMNKFASSNAFLQVQTEHQAQEQSDDLSNIVCECAVSSRDL